ncbi:multidrug efflux MFS transporter outer membrane subunit VceC [Uliginosibacterium flavum]|uniref:Efflux transporter outer membrane subunit n=1 Tax=Uliginosibacterium flavum TaxID=1396831 RepID=A0ABV2TLP1_9RHOO
MTQAPFPIRFITAPVLRYPLALMAVLTLGACAQVPEMGAQPQIKPASAWSATQTQGASVRQWPAENWFQSYGDAQLDALIAEAVSSAPSLRVAEARLHRADAGVQTSNAASGPQLSANASASEAKQSYNYLTPRSMSPVGWNDYGRMTLDFSWELDFWGRNRAALAAATSDREAAVADAAQARLVLGTSIASAYAELARLFAARDTAAAAGEVRSKTASLFHERFDNGMETLGSVRQADARQASAEGDLLAVNEQIALQRNRLAALMGAGPDRGLAITRPAIRLDQAPGLPERLALDLLGRRPDVVASRLRAEAAAKRIDAAQAEFYPNVNLSAFIGAQSLGLDKLFKSGSDIGSAGPAISLPIFSSGRLKAQYKGRRADYDEAVANYEATVTQALHDVADASVSQRALGRQLERGNAAVDAAREAWQIARNRYDGGLSNYLDVLSAEDSLLANLRSLTDLQSRAFSLDVALVRALGGGYRAE